YVLPTTVTGNGAITQATLTGSIIGTPTKVYDGTTAATLTAANYLLTGFVTGEGATISQTSGTYASANASATDAVTVTLAAGDFVRTGTTNLANYVLPTTVTGNGAITQATLTGSIIGTPTKVYDGTTAATLTAANYLLTGFVTGEGATISQTSGTYASANASATDAVTVTLAAGDFVRTGTTNLANYVLPTTVTGNGAINRALLTAAIVGLPTKAFDGTTLADLTSANFNLIGFVIGEGATVTQTQGSYASANVGTSTVTAQLAASDFAANSGTSLANYVLPTTATGLGQIGNAPPPPPPPLLPETRGLDGFTTTPLGEPTGPAAGLELISTETTQRILDEIRAGSAFCKALVHQEYVIDCLSDRLQSVADGLSAVGEYSEVRAALEDAAQELHALALANASTELARSIVRASGNRRSSRPLTAVSADRLGAVNAQAAAIINNAELVLLRSSSGSARRSVAFSQVAQVVNSTKVLLRSS
ncbi:MAG: YDG domain-containing protein, partial [bacterium]